MAAVAAFHILFEDSSSSGEEAAQSDTNDARASKSVPGSSSNAPCSCSSPHRKKPRRRGPKRYDELYPLTEMVHRLVMDKMPTGADRARSETVAYTPSTVNEITKNVHSMIKEHCKTLGMPSPKKLPSGKVIRRQGLAPNPNHRASKYYKGKVNFRRAARRNDRTKFHEDFHYTASQVKTFLELSALFPNEVAFLSCDNKNKVRLGAPANSNPTRPRGMFPTHRRPSVADHSFPARDAHIVPMGYMLVNNVTRTRHRSLERKRLW